MITTEKVEYRFWTSRTAWYIYTNVFLALALQRPWLLHGIELIVLAQVFTVGSKWCEYIYSEFQVQNIITAMRGALRRGITEYDIIMHNGYTARRAVLAAASYGYPRFIQGTKDYLRAKNAAVTRDFRRQFESDLEALRPPP